MTMPDIILFMAASFSIRYGVSSGTAASVAVEQIENGVAAADGWLSRPATKAPIPTAATTTVDDSTRKEIDASENDIIWNPPDRSLRTAHRATTARLILIP